MYEIFKKLLDEKGVKAADVAKATGISNMMFSDWKSGKSKPKQDKLMKVAEYFGVSVDYLMTGKKPKDEFAEYQEQAELLITVRHDQKMLNALEKFYKLSGKKKDHVFELIDLLSEVAE